jgi:hypothetical protein
VYALPKTFLLIPQLCKRLSQWLGSSPGATWSKVRVRDLWLAGFVLSNPLRVIDVCLVSFVYCQVEIPEAGRSLGQRDPTEYGGCECNREMPERGPNLNKATGP